MTTIQLTGAELAERLAKRILAVKKDIENIDAKLARIAQEVRPKGFKAWLFWSPSDPSFLHFRKSLRQDTLRKIITLWGVANQNPDKIFNVNIWEYQLSN